MDSIVANPGLQHLLEEILTYLDKVSLANCRTLSKSFKTIIDNSKPLIILQWRQMSKKDKIGKCPINVILSGNWQETFLGFERLDSIEEMKELLEFLRQFYNYIQTCQFQLDCLKNPIHYAMRLNDVRILKLLTKCRYQYDFGMLQYACSKGFADSVAYLLSLPDVNVNRPYGQEDPTPFYLACKYGHLKVVKVFLKDAKENNIDLDERFDYKTPLHVACENGHLDVVSLLLDQSQGHSICIRATDDIGRNLLHFASSSNNCYLVKMLLEKNFDINVRTNFGTTPFHYACSYGNLDIIKVFLDNAQKFSINLNAQNIEGRTPIFFACQDKKADATIYLIENYQKYGIDLTTEDVNGRNLLHMACLKGLFEVTKLLLSKLNELGLDKSAETKNNFTALHFATYSGNVEMATLLIKNGLNVNAKDLHGQTPLHIACSRFGSFDIIKMFLDKAIQNQITIDFNATDVYERTPLNVAEEKGFEGIAILIRNVMKKHLS